ncbi:MAG: hypothetical protein LLG44_05800 [Chloroflexi bacterium]|nr:hypothetical protein [Chloroflexota bacterium]
MDSGMISKIEKARRYAEERDRVTFQSFHVEFRGEHNNYLVSYDAGVWNCQCDFFLRRGVCSHTMAMERILEPMLNPEPEEQPAN